MTLNRIGWLASAGCLFLLLGGCDSDGSSAAGAGGDGGAAGDAGAGGEGGMAGAGGDPIEPPAAIAGLWEGGVNGFEVCFFVRYDGLTLEASERCDLPAEGAELPTSSSFDVRVELVGSDQNGESCSLDFQYAASVPIDQSTGAFRVLDAALAGGGSLSFSGEIGRDYSSGMARVDSDGSSCEAAWSAGRSAACDEPAIQACLDLQDCCRAILVNPVFFESCNSVVLQCDRRQCEEVLAGYPQCESEELP